MDDRDRDRDLDDAALWASVDTVAEASRRKSPSPSINDDPHRGEVLQPTRPFKLPRLASHGHATPPPPSLPPSYMTPDPSRRLLIVESPQTAAESSWVMEPNAGCFLAAGNAHGLFPSASVANFKKYQEVAVSILEKSDYTLISGNPYIKKSGWRKISCFFNISFEIKNHSIEFDDSRNVNRAEFLVRASMQGGRFSDGWGSCDRREKRFNKPNHDIPSTAETRAKNKACQLSLILCNELILKCKNYSNQQMIQLQPSRGKIATLALFIWIFLALETIVQDEALDLLGIGNKSSRMRH